MRVAVIGCGAIGNRRGAAVRNIEELELVLGTDTNLEKAKQFAQRYRCEWSEDWQKTVAREDIDIVIVSASNDMHALISIAAMKNGKHVLCEKPLARNPKEAQEMVEAAEENKVKLKTGFNHRYHNVTRKAREFFEAGKIGEVVFIRGRTGHGGRQGYEKTWFCNAELSGGGTFLDNGVHLLDLARWFMGDFVEAVGYRTTNIWPIQPLEDNGFGLFRTADNRICSIHSSWTQWKGYLFMEIFGANGYILINYDNATTTLGTRPSRWASITEEVFDLSKEPDRSWELEIRELIAAIKENRQPLANGYDGWQAVRMAYAIYESSEKGQAVKL